MNSSAQATPLHRQLLLVEILDLHARGLLRMPYIQALIVVGIGLFICPDVSIGSFLIWAAFPVGAEALRAWYARGFLRQRFNLDPDRAHLVFISLASLTGLTISAGAVAFFPLLPIVQQALFGATLFALPAAGVAVSSSRYILSGYAVCVLLPASVTWAYLHPSHAVALTALSAAYCVTIFLVSADGEKLVLRSVIIRYERDQLVRDLEQRNADVLAAVHRAELSAQSRARVLAAASHDLRQPLHALSLYSAVLAADPSEETVHELSRNIDQIVRSLGSLLNGLLDLSRLSTAHYVPEDEIFDLQVLLAGLCDEFQQSAAQCHLLLVRDLAPIRMRGDPVAIGRIVRNLLDNAIKYTDRGSVSLSCELKEDAGTSWAILTVADTGRGIAREEHERIFEEFYQVDNPGRDHGKGVGLGLAIVRRLCDLLHGSVSVESMPGQGTRFLVRLPARVTDSILALREAPIHGHGDFAGKHVYVVDDETEILRGMERLFGTWGLQVSLAQSTEESDRIFAAQGAPDLLIVDLRLKGIESGVDHARRTLAAYGHFPILILTGETASGALEQANALGFPLLQKPVAPELLRNSITNLLRARNAEPATVGSDQA